MKNKKIILILLIIIAGLVWTITVERAKHEAEKPQIELINGIIELNELAHNVCLKSLQLAELELLQK